MRTEIKVGFVAVLVVVVGAIFFFINQGKKAGGTADVVPMNAPAQTAVPGAAKTEPGRGKPGERPSATPARPSPTAGEQRPIITPPPGRTPSPTTQPAAARPPTTTKPVASPLTPRPTLTPKTTAEQEAATQPRPTPELPPLAATGEPASRPTAATETPTTPLPKSTPGVSVPPAKETERPAATPLPAAPREAGRKYTVAEGETLWSIAEEQYGDPYLWTKLLAANPGIKENVDVGQVINLPPKEALLAPAKETKPAAKPATTPAETPPGAKPAPEARAGTYVVEKNDTLYSIAAKVLGNGNRWRELLELNKDKLSRPEELKIGMELKVPAKEGAAGKTEPAKPEPKKNGAKKKT